MNGLIGYDTYRLATPPEYEGPEIPEECWRCLGRGYVYIAHACMPPDVRCEACDYEEECGACDAQGFLCRRCGRPCPEDLCGRCYPDPDDRDWDVERERRWEE